MIARTEHVTLTVQIDTGNQAVVDDPYHVCAFFLEQAAQRIRDHRTSGVFHDVNGNAVGDYVLHQDVTEEHRP